MASDPGIRLSAERTIIATNGADPTCGVSHRMASSLPGEAASAALHLVTKTPAGGFLGASPIP